MAQNPYAYLTKIIDNQTGRIISPGDLLSYDSSSVVETTTYVITDSDSFLNISGTESNAVEVTLPTSSLSRKNILVIKDRDGYANTNNITIVTEGSEKIDSEDSFVIDVDFGAVMIFTDGSNFFIYWGLLWHIFHN